MPNDAFDLKLCLPHQKLDLVSPEMIVAWIDFGFLQHSLTIAYSEMFQCYHLNYF